MNKILTIYPFLLLILFTDPIFPQTTTPQNPVVIRYGEQEITRRQFELDFELMMVVSAVQSGVPVKDPLQIITAQQRYLSQRSNEFVMLDMAGQRGISISEDELIRGLNELMNDLGFLKYNGRNLAKLGIANEQRIRSYIKEKLVITQLILQLKDGLENNENGGDVRQCIADFSEKKGLETFPERLRGPLSRRSER